MILQSTLAIVTFVSIVLAIFFGLFLFWRAGRRELIESEFLFDASLVALLGAIVSGRLVDFVVRFDYYKWSFGKLIFFNVYRGFDFYGSLIGILIFLLIKAGGKKDTFWLVFDLMVAPIAFGASVVFFLYLVVNLVLRKGLNSTEILLSLFYFACYFVIFWILKRLEVRKRHRGFFGCVFLILFSIANIAIIFFESRANLAILVKNYDLAILFILLLFSAVSWYFLAKRRLKNDTKSLIASFLLSVFKFRRVFTSFEEANRVARSVILLPYSLVKGVYFLVKLIGRELFISILDLVHAFGVKR